MKLVLRIAGVMALALGAFAPGAMAATTASDTEAITVTAPVTASIVIQHMATVAAPTVAVTNFALAETAPGADGTASSAYLLRLTSTSAKWALAAEVTGTFTSGGGSTLADSDIQVDGAIQAGTYVDMSAAGSTSLQTNIARGTLDSSGFTFRLSPAAGADSGSYSGTITLTASTL